MPSADVARELFKQSTGVPFRHLLTIDHPDFVFGQQIRLCDGRANVISRGNTFAGGFPFQVSMPAEAEEKLGRSQLIIENISRTILAAILNVPGRPMCLIEVIDERDPDTVEFGPLNFEWVNTRWDNRVITAELRYTDLEFDTFPGFVYSPATTPGMF